MAEAQRKMGEEQNGALPETTPVGGLRKVDSFHLEAGRVPSTHARGAKDGWMRTMSLAFQCIGVVYGDIGTSPLYVFSSTFTDGITDKEDILGVLSLIIYTLIIIPMLKYVFLVLQANDNGDGGTFALYSLICRYARVSLLPNQQVEDMMVSNYKLETPTRNMRRAEWIKEKLETSRGAKTILFLVTIIGTSMVLGDGVLTPCISVLSAVGGIKGKVSSLSQGDVVGISIAILIVLFAAQRFGTDRVGYVFAPIILLWFAVIGGTGVYNLVKHDVKVLRALNPKYIIDYFKRNGKTGWISLGGVVLCITGTEAMFADLGHFNIRAVQISFTGVLLPSVSLAYVGQAAYLTKFPENVDDTFYKSIPHAMYWPTFVVAVAAAIIASQAMISGAFSIIAQSLALGCFPRVKVVHTSAKYEGQVYIPEINYVLMFACVVVTAAFRTTQKIGNAYGIAVVSVMLLTTFMVALIMLVIWKTSIWWVILFVVVMGGIESVYFSSALYKFLQGGYLPLALACCLVAVMATWHYVHKEKYLFEMQHKVSGGYVRDLVALNPNVRRVPGIGLFYSEMVQGIPPIFPHFISNVPSIHSVLVFVSIKHLPISRVAPEERFLFRHVEPKEYRMFRCVVRYGYKDDADADFERLLVQHLKEFVRCELAADVVDGVGGNPEESEQNQTLEKGDKYDAQPKVAGRDSMAYSTDLEGRHPQQQQMKSARVTPESLQQGDNDGIFVSTPIEGMEEEEEKFIQRAMDDGVVYLLGEAVVVAAKGSSLFKKVVVDYLYDFLRRNFRQSAEVMAIPHGRLLRVGMTYEI